MAQRYSRLLVIFVGLGLAGLVFWPVLQAPKTRILGTEYGENQIGVWFIRWIQNCILEQHVFPLRAENIIYETGMIIYPNCLLTGIITLPAALFLDPIPVYNLALIFNFLLAFWTAFWLFKLIGGADRFAYPGAIAFVLSPYYLSSLNFGPMETTATGWISLSVAVAEYCRRKQGSSWQLIAVQGLTIGLAFSANPYYGLFALFAEVFLILFDTSQKPRLRFLHAALVAAAASLFIAPLAATIVYASMQKQSALPLPTGVSREKIDNLISGSMVVDALSFFCPTERYYDRYFNQRLYLGLSVMALSMLALLRTKLARRWVLLAAMALLFSAGGVVRIAGRTPLIAGQPIPLPAKFLCVYVPLLNSIRHPYRAAPIIMLALGAMITLLFAHGWPFMQKKITLLLSSLLIMADLLFIFPSGVSRIFMELPISRVYSLLGSDNDQYGVLDIPVSKPFDENAGYVGKYFIYQLFHHKLIPYYISGIKEFSDNPFIKTTRSISAERLERRRAEAPNETGGDELCQGVDELRNRGYRYVILHHQGYPQEPPLEALLTRCVSQAVYRDSEVSIYCLQAIAQCTAALK